MGRDPRAPWENRTRDALSPLPSQGLEIVFRVGLALLQVNQMELMQLDMEGMSQVGQGPRAGWDPPAPHPEQRYLGRQSSGRWGRVWTY